MHLCLIVSVCVGVIFFASRTPHPACPCSSTHSTYVLPPPLPSPSRPPPTPPSSSLVLQPHLLSTNLLSHHTLCGVISIKLSKVGGVHVCALCCSLYEVFIYPSTYTCAHAHRHTDRPLILYLYFSARQPNSHQSQCLIFLFLCCPGPTCLSGVGV